MNMKDRIEKLNRYLVGWFGYYQLAETPSIFKKLDSRQILFVSLIP